VNLFRRIAIGDTELAGQKIAEGDKVVMFYSSANRDEDAFTAPREFDICRDPASPDGQAPPRRPPRVVAGVGLALPRIRKTG
jgi:cytochrome P450